MIDNVDRFAIAPDKLVLMELGSSHIFVLCAVIEAFRRAACVLTD
jgi:hypothetical protein